MPRILVFSGATRTGSLNQRLADIAASQLGALGAEVTSISLADYPLPFVGEEGRGNAPEAAHKLAEVIGDHQGLFITCPEYNAGYPPILKNALDWVSLAKPGAPASTLAGKVVALGAASPGPRGGYRGLTQFRSVLELGYGALVIPEMVSVPMANKTLTEAGEVADEMVAKFLEASLKRLALEAGFARG